MEKQEHTAERRCSDGVVAAVGPLRNSLAAGSIPIAPAARSERR